MHEDVKSFFLAPKTPKQRQYEALRAYVIEELTAQVAAARFGLPGLRAALPRIAKNDRLATSARGSLFVFRHYDPLGLSLDPPLRRRLGDGESLVWRPQ